MIGAMTAQGYSKGYSGALIAAGSTIGPVIPPSIPMIMYGVTIGVSVSYMFIAGIIPGVLMSVALMIYNYFASKKRGYKGNETKAKTGREKAVVLKEAIPAILMPVIILGDIYSGVFTPTESAVIGVVYAIIVAVFVYHHLSRKAFCEAMFDAAITSATIMILFGAANTFGRILTMNRVPAMITDWMMSITSSRAMIMLMLNIALLIIGMFLDTISSIVLFGPIFAPIAIAIGFDPLHFGIIMVINLCIGMLTPPMGGNLFVAQRLFICGPVSSHGVTGTICFPQGTVWEGPLFPILYRSFSPGELLCGLREMWSTMISAAVSMLFRATTRSSTT